MPGAVLPHRSGTTYRGTVTRVSVAGVWCYIPLLVPGVEFGPLPWISDSYQPDLPVLVVDVGVLSLPDLIVVGVVWPATP